MRGLKLQKPIHDDDDDNDDDDDSQQNDLNPYFKSHYFQFG